MASGKYHVVLVLSSPDGKENMLVTPTRTETTTRSEVKDTDHVLSGDIFSDRVLLLREYAFAPPKADLIYSILATMGFENSDKQRYVLCQEMHHSNHWPRLVHPDQVITLLIKSDDAIVDKLCFGQVKWLPIKEMTIASGKHEEPMAREMLIFPETKYGIIGMSCSPEKEFYRIDQFFVKESHIDLYRIVLEHTPMI